MNIKLSQRLNAIFKLVKSDSSLIDMGTDHGYLAIAAAQNNHKAEIWAIDKRLQPLKNAQLNFKLYKLDNSQVHFIQADNLQSLQHKKINVCVIAGLGSKTILQILTSDYDGIQRYVLCSSDRDNSKLRIWARKENYQIQYEELIKEDNIFYEIIEIVKHKSTDLTPIQILCGPVLLKNQQDGLFREKWCAYLKFLQNLIIKIPLGTANYFTIKIELDLLSNIFPT